MIAAPASGPPSQTEVVDRRVPARWELTERGMSCDGWHALDDLHISLTGDGRRLLVETADGLTTLVYEPVPAGLPLTSWILGLIEFQGVDVSDGAAGVVDLLLDELIAHLPSDDAEVGQLDVGDLWVRSQHEAAEIVGVATSEAPGRRKTRAAWTNLGELQPRRQQFMMYPYVPIGSPTTLAGDGGLGKSYAALALAAAVTTGREMPNGDVAEVGRVLILSAEDDLEEVVVPRFIKLGADRSKIEAHNFKLGPGYVLDDAGLDELEERVNGWRPRLVIVDPITHFMGDKRDMHRANEVRPVITRLGAIAARNGCAMLVLAHVNKSPGGSAAHKVLGSVDFRNAVRSLLIAGRLEDEPDRGRALFHNKANGSVEGTPIGYDITPDQDDPRGAGIFAWTATDLTQGEVFGGKAPKLTKNAIARDMLQALLDEYGKVDGGVAERILTAGGHISERTVRRARQELGVDIVKHADGSTTWKLVPLP